MAEERTTLPQHMRTPLCDCTGSSGYEGDYYTTAEICDSSNLSVRSNSVELRRSGDLPSLCPTPNLDRGRIFVDATPPTTTHDTTGSSGYGSDYISATELISDEACRRTGSTFIVPRPQLWTSLMQPHLPPLTIQQDRLAMVAITSVQQN